MRQEQEGHFLASQGNTVPLTSQVTGHLCRQKGTWGHHMSVLLSSSKYSYLKSNIYIYILYNSFIYYDYIHTYIYFTILIAIHAHCRGKK